MKNIYILFLIFIITNSTNAQYSLWSWGENKDGLIGNGSPENEEVPILVDSSKWKQVLSYYGIKEDGTLWKWGLPNGLKFDAKKPTLFDSSNWKSISQFDNGYGNIGIKDDGSIWYWGRPHGLFFEYASVDYDVDSLWDEYDYKPLLFDDTKNWEMVFSNSSHFFGLDADSNIYVWGITKYHVGLADEESITTEDIPRPFQIGKGKKWVEIQNENLSLVCKAEDSHLYYFGLGGGQFDFENSFIYFERFSDEPITDYNYNGDLEYIDQNKKVFKTIQELDTTFSGIVTQIKPVFTAWLDSLKFVKNTNKSFAFYKNDSVFIAFRGIFKEINPNSNFDDFYRKYVNISLPLKIKDLYVDNKYLIAISVEGYLYALGNNESGQLGTGESRYYTQPQPIMAENSFKDVAAARYHCLAIDQHGFLWGWGENSFVEPDLYDFKDEFDRPVLINYENDWEKIFCSQTAYHASQNTNFAIKEGGTLWTWGKNETLLGYELDGENNLIPKQLPGSGWKEVSASDWHAIAVKEDGTLWIWGEGYLGFGDSDDKSLEPKQIFSYNDSLKTGWIEAKCGNAFSIAKREDGTLWGWGDNSKGVLGFYDEDNNIYNEPIFLENASELEISSLEANDENLTLFSNNSKNLHHWGEKYKTDGFLEKFPTSIKHISSSYFFNLVVSGNSKLYAWKSYKGREGSAHLGIENWNSINQITEYEDWIKVDAGLTHIIGLRDEEPNNADNDLFHYQFSLYPNPSKSGFTIELDKFYTDLSVRIINRSGKQVHEQYLDNGSAVAYKHNLPAGLYFAQVYSEGKLITTNKFIAE